MTTTTNTTETTTATSTRTEASRRAQEAFDRTNARIAATMTTLAWGTEIETFGLSRQAVCTVVQGVVGGRVQYLGGSYDCWACIAPDGREWKAMSDASIMGGGLPTAELVTPKCTMADMANLQAIVRALRAAGAKVNTSTGQHVHVDGAPFKANLGAVRNLVDYVASMEPVIFAALGVLPERQRWCAALDQVTLTRLAADYSNLDDLNRRWYGTFNATPDHYDHRFGTRYRGLNLHSLFFRGTIEMRYFNATLHAGEVKANIMLCLGMAARALNVRGARHSQKKVLPTQASLRERLRWFGLLGEAHQNTRAHLCKRLPGRNEAFTD